MCKFKSKVVLELYQSKYFQIQEVGVLLYGHIALKWINSDKANTRRAVIEGLRICT